MKPLPDNTSFARPAHLRRRGKHCPVWGGGRLSRGRRPKSGCKLALLAAAVALWKAEVELELVGARGIHIR
jgi:hypothetical protein